MELMGYIGGPEFCLRNRHRVPGIICTSTMVDDIDKAECLKINAKMFSIYCLTDFASPA